MAIERAPVDGDCSFGKVFYKVLHDEVFALWSLLLALPGAIAGVRWGAEVRGLTEKSEREKVAGLGKIGREVSGVDVMIPTLRGCWRSRATLVLHGGATALAACSRHIRVTRY